MVEPQLIRDYVAPGDVYYEYRDLAFLGEESVDAAVASRCAVEQDMFWEFHSGVYHNQVTGVRYDSGAFAEERLIEIARVSGLDVDQFQECLDDNDYRDEVEEESRDAGSQGVRSTPSFIINGQLVTGGNYNELRQVIDEALAEAGS